MTDTVTASADAVADVRLARVEARVTVATGLTVMPQLPRGPFGRDKVQDKPCYVPSLPHYGPCLPPVDLFAETLSPADVAATELICKRSVPLSRPRTDADAATSPPDDTSPVRPSEAHSFDTDELPQKTPVELCNQTSPVAAPISIAAASELPDAAVSCSCASSLLTSAAPSHDSNMSDEGDEGRHVVDSPPNGTSEWTNRPHDGHLFKALAQVASMQEELQDHYRSASDTDRSTASDRPHHTKRGEDIKPQRVTAHTAASRSPSHSRQSLHHPKTHGHSYEDARAQLRSAISHHPNFKVVRAKFLHPSEERHKIWTKERMVQIADALGIDLSPFGRFVEGVSPKESAAARPKRSLDDDDDPDFDLSSSKRKDRSGAHHPHFAVLDDATCGSEGVNLQELSYEQTRNALRRAIFSHPEFKRNRSKYIRPSEDRQRIWTKDRLVEMATELHIDLSPFGRFVNSCKGAAEKRTHTHTPTNGTTSSTCRPHHDSFPSLPTAVAIPLGGAHQHPHHHPTPHGIPPHSQGHRDTHHDGPPAASPHAPPPSLPAANVSTEPLRKSSRKRSLDATRDHSTQETPAGAGPLVSVKPFIDVLEFLEYAGCAHVFNTFEECGVDLAAVQSKRFTEHFLIRTLDLRAADAFKILDARDLYFALPS